MSEMNLTVDDSDLLPECRMAQTVIREPAPDSALPQPGREAIGADEEPGLRPADGDWSEL